MFPRSTEKQTPEIQTNHRTGQPPKISKPTKRTKTHLSLSLPPALRLRDPLPFSPLLPSPHLLLLSVCSSSALFIRGHTERERERDSVCVRERERRRCGGGREGEGGSAIVMGCFTCAGKPETEREDNNDHPRNQSNRKKKQEKQPPSGRFFALTTPLSFLSDGSVGIC